MIIPNLFSRLWMRDNAASEEFIMNVLKELVHFLSSMMPERSAKKIVLVVLLLLRIPVQTAARYSGFKKSAAYVLRGNLMKLSSGTPIPGFIARECIVKDGRGRKSPIKGIEDEIIAHIESTNCFTLTEIKQWISDEYGVKVSPRHLSKFLKSRGVRKLKGGSIPAKADPKEQRDFYSDTLLPLMHKAGNGKNVLFFVDAAHFVMGCDFIGCVYCRIRRFARSLSGRARYNVLGALDYTSKAVITVTNDTYIKAESVCELLKKIRAANKGKIIHIVLDNARYQKCECVRELAQDLRINLVYLPSYSPNLNLIERLWRFAKSELRRTSRNDFGAFSKQIDSIIESTTNENKFKIDRLIGEKVQLYDDYVEIDGSTLSKPAADDDAAA